MIALVQKGAAEARARNSKKVSAAHLKSALMQDSQFDFVWGICEKIPDPSEKKRGAKSEAEDSADEMSGGKKSLKKGKRKGTAVKDVSD
jgi:Dr1-associated corepressor